MKTAMSITSQQIQMGKKAYLLMSSSYTGEGWGGGKWRVYTQIVGLSLAVHSTMGKTPPPQGLNQVSKFSAPTIAFLAF